MAAAAAFTKEPIKATEFEFEVVDLGQDQDLEDGDVIRSESISPEQLGRDRSRSLSISEVMYHQLNGTDRMASPVVRAFTRSAVNRWRGNVERKITKRLMEVKAERKKRDAESKELVRLVARTVPFDVLAKDWLNDNEITSEVRIYLLENLLPTLI